MTRKKILVIDDDERTRLRLDKRFRLKGYDVAVAGDAVTALTEARREKPDLIVLDIGLPGGDGYVVLERLQAIPALGQIPVIIFSGASAAENKAKARAMGIDVYIEKTGPDDELLNTVDVYLSDAAIPEKKAAPAGEGEHKKKILVVDDDKATVLRLRKRFQSKGYDVAVAEDGFSALGTVRKEIPDLIVLDIGLPGGDGFKVMERIKTIPALGKIPVVIFSAADPAEKKGAAMKAGAEAYIHKSSSDDELIDAIGQILETR